MQRAPQDDLGRTGLRHLAGIEHDDAVADLRGQREVVQDEDATRVARANLLQDELHDLRLDGDVERTGGLVGEQQLGIAGKRDGDHDPLLHAAGEFVRESGESRLGVVEPGTLEQFDRTPPRCAAIEAEQAAQRARQLSSDGETGVQRRGRVLEDHRDPPAAEGGPHGLRQGEQIVLLGKAHASVDGHRRRAKQAHCDERDRGLAGAGFADQPQRLAAAEIEADAIEHRMAVAGERECGEREQGFAVARRGEGFRSRHFGAPRGLVRHVHCLPVGPQLRVELLSDAVADDAEGDQQQGQRRARHARDPGHDADEGAALGDH